MKTTVQLQDVSDIIFDYDESFVNLTKINAPFTTIVNRAQMVDGSKDLLPKMGKDRISVQDLVRLPDEQGPNGEQVFGALNDYNGQIRYVGGWQQISDNNGVYIISYNVNDFIEVSFYGTGLNYLGLGDTALRDLRASVDGGSEGGNIALVINSSLNNLNYDQNQSVGVVRGLTLGHHTVRLRVNAAITTLFYGFEVLNEDSNLHLSSGSSYNGASKLISASTSVDTYGSNFELGSLGTKGGRVLVYQKTNNAVAKAVNPVNASIQYMDNTDHSNESVARAYNWREFGLGHRGFADLTTAADSRTYTMQDGSTILIADSSSSLIEGNNLYDVVRFVGDNHYMILTFIGSGIDIRWMSDIGGTNSEPNAHEFFIDDVSLGNLTDVGPIVPVVKKLASGLPYGTHVLKIKRNTADSWNMAIKDFIIYQPKKPALPAGAIELAEYNVVANFVANTSGSTTAISTGTIRKNCDREFVYRDVGGTWAQESAFTDDIGIYLEAMPGATASTATLQMMGTGFDFRYASPGTAVSLTFSLNGTTLTAANFPTAVFGTPYGTGAGTFDSSTGILTIPGSTFVPGAGFAVSNLPFGEYTWNIVVTGDLSMFSLDIVTPIHSYKKNGPIMNSNTLDIGSQGVNDLRKLLDKNKQKLLGKAEQLANTVTAVVYPQLIPFGSSGVSFYADRDMTVRASYNADGTNATGGASTYNGMFVDGKQYGRISQPNLDTPGGFPQRYSMTHLIKLSKGFHFITPVFAPSSTNSTIFGGGQESTNFTVEET